MQLAQQLESGRGRRMLLAPEPGSFTARCPLTALSVERHWPFLLPGALQAALFELPQAQEVWVLIQFNVFL